MQNSNQYMMTPLLDTEDSPIIPFNEEFSRPYSSSTLFYTLETDGDLISLFPDLPNRFESADNSNTSENSLSLFWATNGSTNQDILSLMNDVSLGTNNEGNELFLLNHGAYFTSEQFGNQQEGQEERQQQDNDIRWDFQERPKSTGSVDLSKFAFPSPLSEDATCALKTPPNDIIRPESSMSAPLIINNPSGSGTCGRKRQRMTETVFCHICKRPFGRPQEVKRHLKIHIGSKDFKCEVCLFRFLRKDALDRHQRVLAGRCGNRPATSRRSSVE